MLFAVMRAVTVVLRVGGRRLKAVPAQVQSVSAAISLYYCSVSIYALLSKGQHNIIPCMEINAGSWIQNANP